MTAQPAASYKTMSAPARKEILLHKGRLRRFPPYMVS